MYVCRTSTLHELFSARGGDGQQVETLGANELDRGIVKTGKRGKYSGIYIHTYLIWLSITTEDKRLC